MEHPLTEDVVREALRDCYDPAIPCNIVDLGLVLRVAVAPDLDAPGTGIRGVPQRHRVEVDLLTTGGDPDDAGPQQISAQIQNRLAGMEEVSATLVHILKQPVWTPGLITPTGRRTLGLDGNPQLVQISAGPRD